MTRSSAVPYLETMALKTRTALPVVALLVVAVLGVSACGGGGVPGNSVATVGDQTIKRDTFDHWMKIIAISQAGQTNPAAAKTATVPDAPDFKQCIAEKKKTAAKPAKGQPEPTDAQYKTQCQQQYDQFRDQVLGFLIRSTWLDQEANRLKVKVADKTIVKQIDDIKKQQFAQKGSYEKFLQNAGLTNEDVLYQQRIRELQNQITSKVTKGKDKVTDAQIEAYYNKNKSRFSSPERRDLRIVLTKDKAKAAQAKKALDSGQSWKSRGQEVLGRPGLQEQGRRAARRGQGPAGARLRQGDLRGQEGQAHRPGQDAVRLVRLRRHEGHPDQAADARRVQDLDQADPGLPEPAGRSEEVRRRLPQPVQEGDGLPQGVRRRRLQERAEEEGHDDDGAGRNVGQRRAGHDHDIAVGRARRRHSMAEAAAV